MDLGAHCIGRSRACRGGATAGHFVESRSQRCIALVGREVASERECTRDAEWKLLRVTLHDFETGAASELLVERTGGDAMRLSAPLEARRCPRAACCHCPVPP